MDVGTISNVSSALNQFSTQNKTSKAANAYASNSSSANVANQVAPSVGEAYDVDISEAAKQAQQDTPVESTAEKSKGLSADQVRALQENIAVTEQSMLNLMIQALTDSNDRLQGLVDSGGKLMFGGKEIDASLLGIPEVATNPEDAAKAVGEGGQWSVDAVSERLFNLATAIAGDDPEKLEEMRAAVEEGFKQAGATWTNATGLSSMPEITDKTHTAVMKLFDDRMKELTGA